MKVLKRTLGFPFVLGLNIIGAIWAVGARMRLYVLYGIEVAHYEEGDAKLIRDIYDELKMLREYNEEL